MPSRSPRDGDAASLGRMRRVVPLVAEMGGCACEYALADRRARLACAIGVTRGDLRIRYPSSIFPPVPSTTITPRPLSPSIHYTLSEIMGDAYMASIARLCLFQINKFFSKNAPTTQQDCNQEAGRILCVPVEPSPLQGGCSYTVVSRDGAYVVQFRSATSALDMDFVECIEQAYDGFTPRHELVGVFGELHVYKMRNVGGASLYFVRDELVKNNAILLRQTVSDFARYVVILATPHSSRHILLATSLHTCYPPPTSRKPRS